MSEAIAVFDEPKNCYSCPLFERGVWSQSICRLTRKTYYEIPAYHRPHDCPLHVQSDVAKKKAEDNNAELNKQDSQRFRHAIPPRNG